MRSSRKCPMRRPRDPRSLPASRRPCSPTPLARATRPISIRPFREPPCWAAPQPRLPQESQTTTSPRRAMESALCRRPNAPLRTVPRRFVLRHCLGSAADKNREHFASAKSRTFDDSRIELRSSKMSRTITRLCSRRTISSESTLSISSLDCWTRREKSLSSLETST